MAPSIPHERFATALSYLLDETFERVQGIYLDQGTSLFETLDGLSAKEASRASSGRCATLAAQVDHVRFYLDVLERYMLGEEVGEVDWQRCWETRAVGGAEWTAILDRLRESYRRVRATITGMNDWSDDRRLAAALAIVVHTAHHLGEIRQMLCVIRS